MRITKTINVATLMGYVDDFIILPVCIFSLLFIVRIYYAMSIVEILNYFLVGFVLQGLMEYGIHRFLYHGKIKFIRNIHLQHHRNPSEFITAFIGTWIPIILISFGILKLFLTTKYALTTTSGILFSYFLYVSFHRYTHLPREFSTTSFLGKIVHHHLSHHTHLKYNFSVNQPFWDYVFRTNLSNKDNVEKSKQD